jgi:opacity protein-like surface antigen
METRWRDNVKILNSAIVGVVASMALCGSASAQDNFVGWNAGINLNLLSKTTKIEATGGLGGLDGLGRQSVDGGVSLGYTFPISSRGLIGLGLNADIGQPKGFSFETSPGNSINAKQKSRYGVAIEPGYLVAPGTVLYGKLSYNWMESEVYGSGGGAPVGSTTMSFHGFGAGVGMKTLLTKNTYVDIELQSIMYNSNNAGVVGPSTSFRPSSTVASVGIGMNF